MTTLFRPGENIAMKVPAHEWAASVAFYRDVLGFPIIEGAADSVTESVRFRFGDKVLWIDKVAGLSQAEIWLELLTEDLAGAARHLARHAAVRCDEIEPLPAGFEGFWLSSPANIIHLVTTTGQAP